MTDEPKYKLYVCLEGMNANCNTNIEDFWVFSNHIPNVGDWFYYSFGNDGMLERQVRKVLHCFSEGRSPDKVNKKAAEVWVFLDTTFNNNVDTCSTENNLECEKEVKELNMLLDSHRKAAKQG